MRYAILSTAESRYFSLLSSDNVIIIPNNRVTLYFSDGVKDIGLQLNINRQDVMELEFDDL